MLLTVQAYAWLVYSMLSWLLIGPGVGLLAMGAIAWFFYVDDRRSGKDFDEELPSADEYDQLLDAMDHTDQDRREA